MSAPVDPPDVSHLTSEYIAFTNAPALLGKAGSVFAFARSVVLLRIYVRVHIVKSFGKDDRAMILALLFATVTFVYYVLEVPLGLGEHLTVIRLEKDRDRELLKVRQIHMICVVKISVSLFLLQLVVKKSHVWFLYGVIAFLSTFTLVSFSTLGNKRLWYHEVCSVMRETKLMFQCIPMAAAWDIRLRPPPVGSGTAQCFSIQTFGQIGMFNTIINILTDFLLTLLPAPLVWQLQLNLRTKISLILVLSLGFFACVAGIMKARLNKSILSDPNCFIHDGYSIWNFIELDVGIIAGSLPSIKPFFNRFFDAARGLASGPSKSSGLGDVNMLRYQRHAEPSDGDLALVDYGNTDRPTLQVTVQPPDTTSQAVWGMERATSGEDSILLRHAFKDAPNGVIVTTDVRDT